MNPPEVWICPDGEAADDPETMLFLGRLSERILPRDLDDAADDLAWRVCDRFSIAVFRRHPWTGSSGARDRSEGACPP